jgi:hypothetical protein
MHRKPVSCRGQARGVGGEDITPPEPAGLFRNKGRSLP